MIDVEHLNVRIDTKERRAYLDVKDNKNAFMQYKLHTKNNPNVVEVVKTNMPEELSPIGVEKVLAERLVEFVNSNDYKVKPSCPTFRHFMNRHPEYNYLRV